MIVDAWAVTNLTGRIDKGIESNYAAYATSSTFAATIVRFAFENARPMSVNVLPLPANLSA